MIFRRALLTLVFAVASSMAMAQMGAPEEEAACRHDVRKFCYRIPQSAGNKALQDCLLSNRNILSPRCQQFLTAHKK
jgi:hypothetical protein